MNTVYRKLGMSTAEKPVYARGYGYGSSVISTDAEWTQHDWEVAGRLEEISGGRGNPRAELAPGGTPSVVISGFGVPLQVSLLGGNDRFSRAVVDFKSGVATVLGRSVLIHQDPQASEKLIIGSEDVFRLAVEIAQFMLRHWSA